MNPPNRGAIYRVSRSGNIFGEYDIDRIVELLDSGELLWTDLCWASGMSSWEPLSTLRAEIDAAKAFPPVVAPVTAPVVGRRRTQPPSLQASVPQGGPSVAAGWWWVAGGVALGAVIGLLITSLFPSIVQVDRPVEVVKIVEKVVDRPVEVIRTVEKRVEVPAALTPLQQEAIDYFSRREDALKREVGVGGAAMLPAAGKRIKVFITIDDLLKNSVTEQSIRARVEAVFRRNGFEVVDPLDSSGFVNTFVSAEIFRADDKSTVQVAGVMRIVVSQFCLVSSVGITKRAWVDVHRYENAVMFGSSHFYKFPSYFEDFATQASNDLSKAGPLPLIK
jgi:hypothetical protein